MSYAEARPAVSAASTALLLCAVCVAAFIPPFQERVVGFPPLAVVFGVGIATTLVVHLVFVAIAARRLGRSAAGWVALALLTVPVGSIVALVLFEWTAQQQAAQASQAR